MEAVSAIFFVKWIAPFDSQKQALRYSFRTPAGSSEHGFGIWSAKLTMQIRSLDIAAWYRELFQLWKSWWNMIQREYVS